MNKRVKRIITLNSMMLFVLIAFLIFSELASKFSFGECLFLKTFHLYCPGCGGTRSLKALINFDIISSFRYNACLPLAVIIYIYYNVRYIVAIVRKNEAYFEKEKYVLLKYYSVFVIVNFILRNILLVAFKIDLIGML